MYDQELSEELDTDVEQDEIMHRGGLYNVGLVPGAISRILIIAGVVLLVAGLIIGLEVSGYLLPLPNYFPASIGASFTIAILLLGLGLLIAGIVKHRQDRREPDELRPIV